MGSAKERKTYYFTTDTINPESYYILRPSCENNPEIALMEVAEIAGNRALELKKEGKDEVKISCMDECYTGMTIEYKSGEDTFHLEEVIAVKSECYCTLAYEWCVIKLATSRLYPEWAEIVTCSGTKENMEKAVNNPAENGLSDCAEYALGKILDKGD